MVVHTFGSDMDDVKKPPPITHQQRFTGGRNVAINIFYIMLLWNLLVKICIKKKKKKKKKGLRTFHAPTISSETNRDTPTFHLVLHASMSFESNVS